MKAIKYFNKNYTKHFVSGAVTKNNLFSQKDVGKLLINDYKYKPLIVAA